MPDKTIQLAGEVDFSETKVKIREIRSDGPKSGANDDIVEIKEDLSIERRKTDEPRSNR